MAFDTGKTGTKVKALLDLVDAKQTQISPDLYRVVVASGFATLQDAVNDLARGKELLIPSKTEVGEGGFTNGRFYNEAVSTAGVGNGRMVSGQGIQTRISQNGAAHTFNVDATTEDWLIENLWIDHSGTGSFDALHCAAAETRISNVDVDDAPRYGINLVGERCQILDCQILVSDVAFVRVGGNTCTVSNLIGLGNDSVPSGVIFLKIDGNSCTASGIVFQNVPNNGKGIEINGVNASVSNASIVSSGTGVIGVEILGSNNQISCSANMTGSGSTGCLVSAGSQTHVSGKYLGESVGVHLSGSSTEITVNADAKGATGVLIDANRDLNSISGRFEGSVNAVECNGTRNTLSGMAVGAIALGGLWNTWSGSVQGNVTVSGGSCYVSGVIRGDLTVSGDDNIINAVVTGTVSDTGTGNTINT